MRNDIIEYINECENCYSAMLGNSHKAIVRFIKYKRVFKDVLILGVGHNEIEQFNQPRNENISVVFWNKIKGYQLKGYRIPKEDEHNYYNEIEQFNSHFNDNGRELSKKSLVFCSIKAIYNVTPGKSAGKLVDMR